ncbi:MAG: putative membrane protein [Cyclobacteriaceae bacterium]|jgi:uncharacterized membrane protein
MDQPVFIFAVLAVNITLSIWLEKHTRLSQLGAALLSIVITAITANLGIIPSSDEVVPLYNGIFAYVAPISIFYLLLGVSLKALKKAGKPMLTLFLLGAVGTCLGVVLADAIIGSYLGPNRGPIGGMIAGTYIGGSINFNAVALHHNMLQAGPTYASIVAVDNIYTTLWMIITLIIPPVMRKILPRASTKITTQQSTSDSFNQSSFNIHNLAILVVLGLSAFWLSESLSKYATSIGISIPSILILTSIALGLAQMKFVQRLSEANIIGLYMVYLFLAVIGAYCNFPALSGIGTLAVVLLVYLLIVVMTHGLVIFISGWLLRYDWEMVAIASQANIGGSSSALALAKSMKRDDLMLAAVLVGSLGNGLGTYLGFLIADLL